MPAVEQCPHRDDVQIADGEEVARCNLLCQIAICGQELASFQVPRAACEACVDGIPPSTQRLNPVLSSFLYSAAEEIIQRGGTESCDVARAEELQQWAQSFLEVEVAEERSSFSGPRSHHDCTHFGRLIGYRHEPSIEGLARTAVHACHHAAHTSTTAIACRSCLDWSQNANANPMKLRHILPQPTSWSGGGTISWAVGMTTTQRRTPTLVISLEYLQRAGWDNVLVAVDGKVNLSPSESAQITLRTPAVGAWPNFYLTLLELTLVRPNADAFLMIQDDALFHDRENMREYLDTILWPADPPGILSLYCSAAYTREAAGWTVADQRWEWGALAFVFPAELARDFVSDPQVIRHRLTDRGLRYIDDVIGEWAERNGIPIWYPTPSLVQHIGDTSTVWPGVPAEGYRRADSFVGDA